MKIEVHVHIHGDADDSARLDELISLVKGLKEDMALTRQQVIDAISQSTAEVKQHVTDASARVTKTLNDQTAVIEGLKTKIGDPLTQEDVDALVAGQKQVITAVDSIDPNSPPPVPIEPVAP